MIPIAAMTPHAGTRDKCSFSCTVAIGASYKLILSLIHIYRRAVVRRGIGGMQYHLLYRGYTWGYQKNSEVAGADSSTECKQCSINPAW